MGRVLVVEDSVELAENLGEILESQGHEPVIVHNAEDALEALLRQPFDGMLTDLKLPGPSGLELLQRLRARGFTVPVILMTAFADAAVTEDAMLSGARAVIFKPFDLERLLELIGAFNAPPPQLLIVEDNRAYAANLADVLEQHGYRPRTVHSLAEALACDARPRVALVDLVLPDGTGLDAARQLVARDPSLRVILMSGHRDEFEAVCADQPLKYLAAMLEKPIDLTALLNLLRKPLPNL